MKPEIMTTGKEFSEPHSYEPAVTIGADCVLVEAHVAPACEPVMNPTPFGRCDHNDLLEMLGHLAEEKLDQISLEQRWGDERGADQTSTLTMRKDDAIIMFVFGRGQSMLELLDIQIENLRP